MRNYPLLGPAPLSPNLPVSREALAAADPKFSYLQGHALRVAGQLSTISKGWSNESGNRWGEQNKSIHMRAPGHEAAQRIIHTRGQQLSFYLLLICLIRPFSSLTPCSTISTRCKGCPYEQMPRRPLPAVPRRLLEFQLWRSPSELMPNDFLRTPL
jgi:hypothetical protein